ncbi:hypothetical protein JCM16303_000317 [Sporobolomyces ruberrimus]
MSYHYDFQQYPETQGNPRFYQSFQPHNEFVRPNHARGFVSNDAYSYPHSPGPYLSYPCQFNDAMMIPATPGPFSAAHPHNSWFPPQEFPTRGPPNETFARVPDPLHTPQHPRQTPLLDNQERRPEPFRVADRRSIPSVPMTGVSQVYQGAWAHEEKNHWTHPDFQPEIMTPHKHQFVEANNDPYDIKEEHWQPADKEGKYSVTKVSDLRRPLTEVEYRRHMQKLREKRQR